MAVEMSKINIANSTWKGRGVRGRDRGSRVSRDNEQVKDQNRNVIESEARIEKKSPKPLDSLEAIHTLIKT